MPLKIIRNNILQMEVDAIVNPTDNNFSGSGSIDYKIHQASIGQLKNELKTFGKCNPADAAITNAYNLPCKYIIHTVGPIWNKDSNPFKILESCYINCLSLATEFNLESIAFPLIATGTFGCPIDKAIQIAINTINSYLIENELDLNVYLVVYNSEAFGISKKLVEDVKSYIETDIIEDERIKLIQKLFYYYTEEEIKIVRSKRYDLKPMYPEDACIQMELLGHDFFVFVNAETDEVNVVYKRKGGTYGIIEPEE